MKKIILLLAIACGVAFSCDTTKPAVASADKPTLAENDTIRISNKDAEFEILIFDPEFNSWFNMNAKPKSFFTQRYLEARNIPWVAEWNSRVAQPARYGNNYDFPINYYHGTDYGMEVNYMLYYYLTYFQLKYNQRLGGLSPRI